ncbi:hypothetical protein HYN86_01345 [Flavobacterium fluviale]|uniref:Uncharacterized protein n=1 Tax=Flavobacterium fluviale TaxID=2249356 RepID=A0A344LN29_9FLAO|nr:hypothetical protein HYN86_01345 [Flavobacterium fluviale]
MGSSPSIGSKNHSQSEWFFLFTEIPNFKFQVSSFRFQVSGLVWNLDFLFLEFIFKNIFPMFV